MMSMMMMIVFIFYTAGRCSIPRSRRCIRLNFVSWYWSFSVSLRFCACPRKTSPCKSKVSLNLSCHLRLAKGSPSRSFYQFRQYMFGVCFDTVFGTQINRWLHPQHSVLSTTMILNYLCVWTSFGHHTSRNMQCFWQYFAICVFTGNRGVVIAFSM